MCYMKPSKNSHYCYVVNIISITYHAITTAHLIFQANITTMMHQQLKKFSLVMHGSNVEWCPLGPLYNTSNGLTNAQAAHSLNYKWVWWSGTLAYQCYDFTQHNTCYADSCICFVEELKFLCGHFTHHIIVWWYNLCILTHSINYHFIFMIFYMWNLSKQKLTYTD